MKQYRKKPVVVEAVQYDGDGEYYPCKPDVFAATYEPVQPTTNCSQLEQTFRVKVETTLKGQS